MRGIVFPAFDCCNAFVDVDMGDEVDDEGYGKGDEEVVTIVAVSEMLPPWKKELLSIKNR